MTRPLLVLALVVLWYGAVGHRRVRDWRSELTLWTRAVAMAPHNPRAHLNLAKALYGDGREPEAVIEVNRWVACEERR